MVAAGEAVAETVAVVEIVAQSAPEMEPEDQHPSVVAEPTTSPTICPECRCSKVGQLINNREISFYKLSSSFLFYFATLFFQLLFNSADTDIVCVSYFYERLFFHAVFGLLLLLLQLIKNDKKRWEPTLQDMHSNIFFIDGNEPKISSFLT